MKKLIIIILIIAFVVSVSANSSGNSFELSKANIGNAHLLKDIVDVKWGENSPSCSSCQIIYNACIASGQYTSVCAAQLLNCFRTCDP